MAHFKLHDLEGKIQMGDFCLSQVKIVPDILTFARP